MKLKIGDYVIIKKSDALSTSQFDCIGEIYRIGYITDSMYKVENPSGMNPFFLEREVELAKIAANKLSRRLYPNWTEKEGYLYAV